MTIPIHRFAPAYGPAPRLRQLEVTQQPGNGAYVLRDTVDGSALELSTEALAIASFFDGTRDLRNVQAAIYQQYGQLLYIERIHELARALWRAGFFEGTRPRRDEAADELARFRENPLRPPLHAGGAYEADPARLHAQLDALFTHPDGPGAIPAPFTDGRPRVSGLVVPHIDLVRGGPSYAHAYRALAEGTDADLFVVFGTAHVSPPSLFTLTRRHYDTPLGPVPTDTAVVEALAARLGEGLFADELTHRDEHAIEFQAVWLRHLFGDRPISMVPVLCSSLYGLAANGGRPEQEPEIERFLAALAEVTAGRNVCVIAAADLSHVGALFGDAAAPDAAQLAALRTRDLESMERVLAGDAAGFFDHVSPDGESRRICGLAPVYFTLRALGPVKGRLLRYDQWFGADEGSVVTYAAASLERA